MKSKSKMVFWLFLVFFGGIAVGVGGTLVGIRSFAAHRFHDGPDATRSALLKLMQRELRLSDEQLRGLEPVAIQFQTRLLEIRGRNQPELLELFGKTQVQLEPLLTPEQLGVLKGRVEQLKQRWSKDEAWLAGRK